MRAFNTSRHAPLPHAIVSLRRRCGNDALCSIRHRMSVHRAIARWRASFEFDDAFATALNFDSVLAWFRRGWLRRYPVNIQNGSLRSLRAD